MTDSGFGPFRIIFTFCIDYFQITVFCDKLDKRNNIIPPRSFLKDSSCFATETCFNIFQISLANPEVCLKPFIIVCLLGVAAFPGSQSNELSVPITKWIDGQNKTYTKLE